MIQQYLLRIFTISCVLFFSIGFLTNCKNEPKPQPIQKTYTNSGKYEYVHHVRTNGDVPRGGDTVVLHYCLRNKEKIISCTHYRNKPISLTLPSSTVSFPNPPPLFEAAAKMAAGDSITLYYPLAGKDKPNGFEDADFVLYDINVLEIKPKETK